MWTGDRGGGPLQRDRGPGGAGGLQEAALQHEPGSADEFPLLFMINMIVIVIIMYYRYYVYYYYYSYYYYY